MADWDRILLEYKVKDVLRKGFSLISVMKSDSLLDAINVLATNDILCVPVFDPATSTFTGLLDTLDVATAFVMMIEGRGEKMLKEISEMSSTELVDYTRSMRSIQDMTLDKLHLTNLSQRNAWCPVYEEMPLNSLMDILSSQVNIHRVPVVDKNGTVTGIVTQFRCLEFANERLFAKFPELVFDAKVDSMRYSSPVESVTISDTAFTAFSKMVEKGIAGLAVVDDSGKLCGAISASDLRSCSSDGTLFSGLTMPVLQFLESRGRKQPPLCCQTGHTVKKVVDSMLFNHVHRVFVCDDAKKPIGVISVGDIMSYLKQLSNVD